MDCIFTVVIGYVRELETLLNNKIIPAELKYIINYYYKCAEIILPPNPMYSDESTSSTDESTSEENQLDEISDSDEIFDKDLPEWRKYWGEKELYGRYLPIKELSRDARSVVFEGKYIGIKLDKNVCIKLIRRVFNTDTDAKRVLRELKILRTLSEHESIMQLYDILPPIDPTNFKTLTIVLEYVDADLSTMFKTKQYFSSNQIEYIFYGILCGINYIHCKGIVHRDIRPSNILINADCSIKISDFGLALTLSGDIALDIHKVRKQHKRNCKRKYRHVLWSLVIKRFYRAPEVMLLSQKQEYLQKMDIWSVGCIFAELLQMQKENCATVWKRGPLFPGDSCFPLSPKRSKKKNAIYQSHFDQIRVIFEVLGTPTKEEIASLNDE
eukprot:231601_1